MPKFGTHLESCFEEDCYIFTWTIRNFSSLRERTLFSPSLSLFSDFQCECRVDSNYLDYFKCSVKSSKELVCLLTLTDIFDKILLQKRIRKRDYSSHDYPFEVSDGSYEKLKNLPNDTLILAYRLNIPISYTAKLIVNSMAGVSNPVNFLKTLAKNMDRLPSDFSNQKVTLSVGEKTTTVNKSVLCASSPVFAKMFEIGMREETENTITFEDISMHVLEALIYFLYTGIVKDGDMTFLCSLHYVADKYDIPELRDGCRNWLKSKITVDNVSKLLKLIDALNDELLKSHVVAFLGLHLHSVLLTKGWIEMMHNEARIALEAITAFYSYTGE